MKSQQEEPKAVSHIHLSSQQETELASESLGEKLKVVIDNLPPDRVTLAEIRDLFGQDGLLLLTAFLTIPFMIPVSIPGVSTVFGSAILLIGISRILGRNLWLPKRFAQHSFPSDKLRSALHRGLTFFHRLERLTRPHRLKGLMSRRLADFSLILGAILLMAPFGLIPFSNTLPGLALLFLAIGLIQRDGVCILLGHLVNLATILYFLFLIGGGAALIRGIWQHFAI